MEYIDNNYQLYNYNYDNYKLIIDKVSYNGEILSTKIFYILKNKFDLNIECNTIFFINKQSKKISLYIHYNNLLNNKFDDLNKFLKYL